MNGYPNGLSMAIQIVYQPQSSGLLTIFQVDNRPLSKWFINGYPNSLSATIHMNY